MRTDQLPVSYSSLSLFIIIFTSNAMSLADGAGCNYRSTQQLFDLPKFSLDGCTRLKSLTQIFGDGSTIASSTQAQKLTATRFITASLVFTGTVTHVRKDPTVASGTAHDIVVQPHCFIKGKLSGPAAITLSGLLPSAESGLCLPISCEVGDAGLFFATHDNDGDSSGSRAWINENGFIRSGGDLTAAMATLRCRENADSVTPMPAAADADEAAALGDCSPIGAADPACRLSLEAAAEFLRRAFVAYEADLKPECQLGKDTVMRRLMKAPAAPMAATGSGATVHHRQREVLTGPVILAVTATAVLRLLR